ncbi:hypothetical protein F2Q68_00031694 [Brassica cretica]|uniref:Uncharacterized protein n=1 Tax=Brassica cretica TaxID=69181 RepID=A0A8S9G9X4_BRACR|nr:hypothetical protein F2Q68_00031694 [Brassica cretica]
MPASVEKSPPAAPSTTRRSGSVSKGGPVKFPDHVEFKYDGDIPLAHAPMECAELSDGSMNFVVEMYDTALKETISKLKQADQLVRVERKSDRPGTAAILQTPTSSQGDHAIERSNEQTGRDLEGLSVQERGDVSGVERTEDTSEPTTAPDVSNQAPVALDLMVREEPSIPTLGVSDEDPTLPLVKLSDSSAEEDGNKSDEQVPASNPQGKEGNLGESSARV